VRQGRWSELAELVDDEMLDAFVPSATYDELAGLLAERYAGLAHEIGVPLAEDPSDDAAVARLVEALRT
jgi:hypothetical protein